MPVGSPLMAWAEMPGTRGALEPEFPSEEDSVPARLSSETSQVTPLPLEPHWFRNELSFLELQFSELQFSCRMAF